MIRFRFLHLIAFLLPVLLLSAPAKKAPAGKKTTGKKASAQKAPTKSRPTRARTATARGRARTKPAPRSYGQARPTPERLTEIQSALAQRGYLQSEPSGAMDTATADALKRFQQDQNLPPTGKISSLSLIALGLGPKRTSDPPAPQ